MKICSLYGAGYYYIPGTDTCIKLGGYVRYEAYHNAPGGLYPTATAAGTFNRASNTFAHHARWRFTADVRSQTEYGTLRSYWSVGQNFHNGFTNSTAGPAVVAFERAFIQFAGFTFGRSESFFAFYNGAAYGLVPLAFDGATGPAGINLAAYTWQFGNGLSSTIALEDGAQRQAGVLNLAAGGVPAFAAGAWVNAAVGGVSDQFGTQTPDIVANIRVDQAWGSAQIMGALHQVGGRYYTNIATPNVAPCVGNLNTTACGDPGDEWGWAIGAGMTLKMPWDAKDTLSFAVAWSEGATRYVANAQGNNLVYKGGGFAVGLFSDAVFANPGAIAGYSGSIELTEAWGGTIAFEHYWTPSLRTSWVFGYMDVEYNGTAKALLNVGCGGAAAFTNCNPDWSAWRLASRTMWNPVANLDVGLEVAYSKIDTGFAGTGIFGGGGMAAGRYPIVDQEVWSATFRVQRNFWP